MPWFRANMTAWSCEYAKKQMSKHSRVYSAYQLDIGVGAFKQAFVIHRIAVTTAVKRTSRTSDVTGEKEKRRWRKTWILWTDQNTVDRSERNRTVTNMTAWLYEYAKKHMSKHSKVYSAYQLDIWAGAFKRAFVIHRNAVTTAVKRTAMTSECDGS